MSVAASYDRIPYHSVALPQTHPDRLATTARLFGLTTPDITSCRVLELGCASGGNLIPMAFNLPGSRFVGIDLSAQQVADGRAAIAALELDNIRIEQASILELTPEWGAFDYIICHGVFSWVERDVQDRILEITRENLTPDGIAFISYNTYPGWHLRETVRHMMRYHVAQFDEPREQIAQARALLAFLASASDGSAPYGEMLRHEAERLSRSSDSYLFHEHLEATNTPVYFHEFVARAERASLLYLSEVSVSDMLTSHFPAEVADTLERISPDMLHLEQYMDFVRNRQFRQTLVCHAGRSPARALSPDSLHGLHLSSRATPAALPVDLTHGTAVEFSSGGQRGNATLPASKAAYAYLGEQWPCTVPIDQLCDAAIDRARPALANRSLDDARRALHGDLFGGVVYGMIGAHTQAIRCTNAPSDTPQAHPLVFHQAQRGHIVANAHHHPCLLDGLTLDVLRLCDGRRRRSDIVDHLADRQRADAAVGGSSAGSPPDARAVLEARVRDAIRDLAHDALLVG